MNKSVGTLRYSRDGESFKLIVEVDEGIVQVARALLPAALRTRLNPQRYAPHITVVRNEAPPNEAVWAEHEGKALLFRYDPGVTVGETYYWLRAFCPTLTEIRTQLGLPPSSEWTRPPDDTDSYHITIGNLK